MPDIVRLRYVGPHPVSVPVLGVGVGMPLAVEPGQVVDVAGKVTADDAEADFFVVELGGVEEPRSFPRSLWAVDTGKKTKE
jgi:hypothetical protein